MSHIEARVLILDANQRSALAAIRSLGKKGVPVIAGDETARTLGGSSRYCQDALVYPSPYRSPDAFLQFLRREVLKREISVVFPMTEVTTHLLLQHKAEFPHTSIPSGPFDAFTTLSDKWELYKLGRALDVPVPTTHLVTSREDASRALQHLQLPIVLKPCTSFVFSQGTWRAGTAEQLLSARDVERALRKVEVDGDRPYLLQERIVGQGQGIFALYDRGRPVAFFAHKRVREKPPSGGVSVLSESIRADARMCEITRRILDHVDWHGVAMAEFKVAPDGTPYLIEINARFWGSLQLAVDAGMDFPCFLYQLATGGSVAHATSSYRVGVRSRWLLGDLDSLYLTLKEKKRIGAKMRAIFAFLAGGGPGTVYEINRWDDLRPFFLEVRRYLAQLVT